GAPGPALWGGRAGLARGGRPGGPRPTISSREYLAATGYRGGALSLDERAVVDGALITAGPQSPVQFARATMDRLGLASPRTLEAYEALFYRGDEAAFPILMEGQAS